MRFIGRMQELNTLERMYSKAGFQMLVMYGRRRVGKTTLLSKFAENKNPVFYTGIESKDEENLRELGSTVFSHYSPGNAGVVFRSYTDVVRFITSSVKADKTGGRHLIIIDEYPYIAENAKEIASVLQREIDHEWKNLNIMLVLCGSSITFMEENVLGEKSPLYGRRTGQMDLHPFDYLTASEFVPDYSPEDKATVYGITGGIPKYLAAVDPGLSLEENIVNQYFDASGYFYEEPKNLLRQEFRDVSLYFSILSAIGSGYTRISEIASRTGFDTPKVTQALGKLEAVRIVRRDVPILNEKNRKLAQYVLTDGMFAFWFRFAAKAGMVIERGYGEQYFANNVRPFLHDYMGLVFEKICQEYVFRVGMSGEYGQLLPRTGKWRGKDPVLKCPSDIDVVGVDDISRTVVIGECKFRNVSFGKEEYETLLDRGRLIQPYNVVKYLIFSLGGVTKWVSEQEDPRVEVVSMTKLFSGVPGQE